ncbi:cytochrome C [Thalassococcus profundi]|uniref:Cytochrome C n=2 Tax=Thalassococcus profundi TaxID=2282382 RepID=A0A369TH17_9RHOB|nr:cytochrome C [Thalassococcus profundi]
MQVKLLDAQSDRGPDAMVRYGCGACHVIPGVAGARGTVGPSLAGFADRAYIAGILTNAPGNLQRWLIDPPLFAPDTAMPDMSVTEADAADMAAYLLSLTGAP